MKTIKITIDSDLLQLIDKEGGNRRRSAFFRQAVQAWLQELLIRKLETKHNEGYARYPVKVGEFDAGFDS